MICPKCKHPIKLYALKLFMESWSDGNGTQGYFTSKEKAWKAAIKIFISYKEMRICSSTYDEKKQRWKMDYYDSMYQAFRIEEIQVDILWGDKI